MRVLWAAIACLLVSAPRVKAGGRRSETAEPDDASRSESEESTIAEPPSGTRPYIYGCGVMWPYWLGIPEERHAEWTRKCFTLIEEMGGTALPADITWIGTEPWRGHYDWSIPDQQVELAQEVGLPLFAYTGLTPDWALPPQAPKNHPGIGYRFPPDPKYTADFVRWCEAVARRYRGKIKYYEFWNEPNGCSWINDGCSNGHMAHTYVPWLKLWYKAMKKGDPDCVLSVGGLDYGGDGGYVFCYLEDIYTHGGGGYFDAVAIHPYGEPLNWQALKDTYDCLVRHGDGHKRIWIGEYGWDTTDEDKKARYLAEVLERLKQPEFHYVFYANHLVLTDLDPKVHGFGLCDGDPGSLTITPRKSYWAYKKVDKSFPPRADKPPEGSLELPPPPEPPTVPNLLRNPNFEKEFVVAPRRFQDDAERTRMKAPEWELWGRNWWTKSGQSADVSHTSPGAQSVGTHWGVLHNVVYQRARVTPGHTYRLSAWTRADSTSDKGLSLWRAVGIDPTGGVVPTAETVQWSERSYAEETWERQSVEIVAESDILTAFARVRTQEKDEWQWFYVDTAELVDVTKEKPANRK